MLVSNDYVSIRDVVSVKETASLREGLEKLLESGYRCIPVLDKQGKKYIGNIYKVDLLRKEVEEELDGPLDDVIRDQDDGHIREDDPFFAVFRSIKRLPFLAVVDDDHNFLGILTNGNVIQVLENSWDVDNGSYSLTIGTIEYSGALQHMLGVINEFSSVQSVITLKNTLRYVRRVCVVLPKDVDEHTVKKIENKLDEHNFTVIHVEKLN